MKSLITIALSAVSSATGKAWKGTKSKLGYTLLTITVEIVRAQIVAKYPNAPIPSVEQIMAFGALLVGCHTLTDIFHAIADGMSALRQTQKA